MSKTPARQSSTRNPRQPARKPRSSDEGNPVVVGEGANVAGTGSESTSTLPGFGDLGLMDELLRAVEEAGYTTPTPIQQQA
ncbi:MAG TPA: DEAD/DEAH box helicase, partial [Gemmatimonadaceae bacterium]|nr:DEAD/DEAH box helicase [Gemmatimonadaceae bacterium]